MDPEDREARRLLGPLRGYEPAAPSTVDLDRARATGARRVRVHRAVNVAATAATVLAVLVAAVVVGHSVRGQGNRPAGDHGAFGVLDRAFSVGSAGGYVPVGYETGRYRQRVRLRPAEPGTKGDGVVTMYAPGRLPYLDGAVWTPGGETATAVEGHRAYWPGRPVIRAGAVELAWEWKPGAWAIVSLKGAGADRAKAHRVAQSVLPVPHDGVPAPVTLPDSALRAGEHVTGSLTSYGPSEAEPYAALLIGPRDPPQPDGDPGRLAVGVQRPPDGRRPDTTLPDGRTAFTSGRTRLWLLDGSGVYAEASDPSYLTAAGGMARLRELLSAARPVPGGSPMPTITPTTSETATGTPSPTDTPTTSETATGTPSP